jgi:hypothetical protein
LENQHGSGGQGWPLVGFPSHWTIYPRHRDCVKNFLAVFLFYPIRFSS